MSEKATDKNIDKGRQISQETKKKISESLSGKKKTKEHVLKKSQAQKKNGLPMFMTEVKARPSKYEYGGYVIAKHVNEKGKQKERQSFMSKELTMEQKKKMALDYRNS